MDVPITFPMRSDLKTGLAIEALRPDLRSRLWDYYHPEGSPEPSTLRQMRIILTSMVLHECTVDFPEQSPEQRIQKILNLNPR